ncbi:MAG: site-specific integrase [Cyclobacteriaceae bacterium]
MGLNIRFLLDKRRAKQDGSFPLQMRIVYNSKPLNISMGYSLFEKEWDASNEKIKPKAQLGEDIVLLNNALHKERTKAYDVFTELRNSRELVNLSMKEIKARIVKKDKTETVETVGNVFDFIDAQIKDLTKAGKTGNASVYKTLKNKLRSFVGHENFTFNQITYPFLKKIETEHYANGNDAGGLSVYMRTLRAVYNKAVKSGLASQESYPFADYKIKGKKPIHKALTEAEFDAFKSVDLSGKAHLIRTRDLYMVSFYLRGMNWMDIAYLKKSNITGDYDRLFYVRKKTTEPFSIKVSEALKVLILKYQSAESDFLFPILQGYTDAKKYADVIRNRRLRLNQYLKRIAEMAEIKPFSIYSARHTYATMSKRKGVPTAVIQQALGQATEAITQTYLDSFENSVIDDYDKIIMGE